METRRYRLVLLGPLQVFHPDGTDISPTGAKLQGLLGLLAATNGAPWTRAALQDKLWSDRAQAQGRDSLKKALAALRALFGSDAKNIVLTKGMSVQLDPALLEVDLFSRTPRATPPRAFLEGLDVKDPEFEEWLADQRAHWRIQTAAPDRSQSQVPLADMGRRKTTFTMAVTVSDPDPSSMNCAYANLVADRAVLALTLCQQFDVIDYRDIDIPESRDADVMLNVRALAIGDDIAVSLSVRRVQDNMVIWNARRVLKLPDLNTLVLASLVTQMMDQLTDVLLRPNALGDPDRHAAARRAMGAIDMMFRLSKPNIARAATDLTKAFEIDPQSSYLAWYAYHTVFRLEATKGQDMVALREQADALIHKVLEFDPHNPLARALLTHVYSFVFRDFERANEMIRPLAAAPPDTPLYYHSLAALKFYTGNMAEAKVAAHHSATLGAHNPYSYAFNTTLTMIDTVTGDFDSAILNAERVVAAHRGTDRYYEPVLRYLAAAYAHKGRYKDAMRVIRMIQRQSPGFSIDALQERTFPVPSEAARDVLLDGLLSIPKHFHTAV